MKYVTLEDGTDFRKIAKIMTKSGFRMNHATARNVLMLSLNKLIKGITGQIGSNLSDEQILNMLKEQRVHEALSEILFEANQQLEEEEKNV